jgi:hypothetical protein
VAAAEGSMPRVDYNSLSRAGASKRGVGWLPGARRRARRTIKKSCPTRSKHSRICMQAGAGVI